MTESPQRTPSVLGSPVSESHETARPGAGWANLRARQWQKVSGAVGVGGATVSDELGGPAPTIPSVILSSYALLRQARRRPEPAMPAKGERTASLSTDSFPHFLLPWESSPHEAPAYPRPAPHYQQDPTWQYPPDPYTTPWTGYYLPPPPVQPPMPAYAYPPFPSRMAPVPRAQAHVPTAPAWQVAYRPPVPSAYGPPPYWSGHNGHYYQPSGAQRASVVQRRSDIGVVEPVGRQVPKPSTESQKSTGPQKRTTSQELDAEFESDVEDFNPKSYTCSWQGCAKTFSTSGNLRRHRTLHLQNERRSTGEQSIRFSRPDSKTETSLMGTNTNARREAREPAGNRDRVPVSDEETESLQESGYVSSVEGVEMDDIKMTEPLGTTIGETADGEPAIDDGRTCESRSFVDGAEADDATLKGDTTISSLVEAVAKAVEAESPVSEMSIARLVEAAVEVA